MFFKVCSEHFHIWLGRHSWIFMQVNNTLCMLQFAHSPFPITCFNFYDRPLTNYHEITGNLQSQYNNADFCFMYVLIFFPIHRFMFTEKCLKEWICQYTFSAFSYFARMSPSDVVRLVELGRNNINQTILFKEVMF